MPLFGKRQVRAQVTALAWSRVIQLEQQEWVAKRASWVPSDDVRNVKKHSETYWQTVTDTQPGTPDANGMPGAPTFQTRQELRSRFYFTFEQLEWHKGRLLRATGTDPSDVHWPQYAPQPRERVRDQKETYSATFASADKQYAVTLPEPEWRALETGGGYHLTLGLFGGVKKVTPSGG